MCKMCVITLCRRIHCDQSRGQPLDRIFLWRVLFIMAVYSISNINAQIRYSVPEEMKKGSLIGNIAHDLGLDVQRLRAGRARIVSGDSTEYVELKTDKGILVVKERIDREQLCAETTPCSFTFEIIIDNPMELHHVTVEILDVNDHSPTFPNDVINLEISESATLGSRFLLGSADDPDVGLNALQHYTMSTNSYFTLKEHSRPDGVKYAEMVLQKPLDREQHPRLSLILTAVDGGNPQRSGNMKIEVTLLDVNDNAPEFNQSVYRATIVENAPKGIYITTVNASDADSGMYSLISYSFANLKGNIKDIFKIDEKTGVITLIGVLDYEKAKKYEIGIEAKDQGGLGNAAKVIVDLIDVNDNAPFISVMSFSSPVTEDATIGTTIAIFSVKDIDAGDNGHVECKIDRNTPFKLQSSMRNYYTLVTDAALDRERVSDYNITITATDSGSPALSSQKTLNLKVSDVNDNPPRFRKSVYTAYVTENNSPGLSIFTLSAQDDDWNQNARISYLLDEATVGGSPVSSFISVNADSGVVHALRGFDYEQMKSVRVCVKAQDGGSPPLSTNVTLDIIIQDQNDNAPQVLYPVQTGGSVVAEIVPRAADVGYLVTKVVAVDVDSGQNAWLSYKLQKATDRALFEVGLQNGEIRTVRQVTDKDAVKQKLTVVVEDNGQPSRSAVVSINVAVADSFPEVLSEFTDFTHEKQYNDNLTFYLVLALAAVSFLFITCVVVIISVKIYRWRQSRFLYQSNLPVIPYYPPHYADTGVTGTLPHGYNYEVCMTTDSRKSDCKFSTLGGQNVLVVDPSFTETMQRAMKEKICLEDPELQEMQKPPNSDWRFPPNQRPGPSGAGVRPDEAGAGAGVIAGTGPWPNPPTEAEQLQALMAAANEVSEATATLGPRYNPQYGPDYRQNVYIPGSTATLTANPQQQVPQQALPPPQALPPAEVPKAAQTPASKKKPTKKDKK
ncbi:protocadherin beta-3-like isoform X19 [Megalobrama amblycephala]|uniref:protocadherin beta-3-like isoform X19 n=1 Tax=Megalobrama amblycephala TaxID=75352 RepID=UPI0020141005|nr:protocadherin beta-3-like isoform X19 [Megalobrama amblycephala]